MNHKGLRALVLVAAVAAVFAVMAPVLHASQGGAAEMNMQMQSDSASTQQAIQAKLDKNVNFADSELNVSVTDDAVVLQGNARGEVEHARALDIARQEAGQRRVIDESTIMQVYESIR